MTLEHSVRSVTVRRTTGNDHLICGREIMATQRKIEIRVLTVWQPFVDALMLDKCVMSPSDRSRTLDSVFSD